MLSMRKQILIIAILLISCGEEKSREDLFKEAIERKVQEVAHDPASYQFVSLSVYDSMFNEDLSLYCWYIDLKCRMKNRMGGLELKNVDLQIDTGYNVIYYKEKE